MASGTAIVRDSVPGTPLRTTLQVANPVASVKAKPPPAGLAQVVFGRFTLEPVLTLTPTLGTPTPVVRKTRTNTGFGRVAPAMPVKTVEGAGCRT